MAEPATSVFWEIEAQNDTVALLVGTENAVSPQFQQGRWLTDGTTPLRKLRRKTLRLPRDPAQVASFLGLVGQ